MRSSTGYPPTKVALLSALSFFKFSPEDISFSLLFRERGRERGRKREKMDERKATVGCLPYHPDRGLAPGPGIVSIWTWVVGSHNPRIRTRTGIIQQPTYVSWQPTYVNQTLNLSVIGQCSNQLSHSARGPTLSFNDNPPRFYSLICVKHSSHSSVDFSHHVTPRI